MFGPEFFIGFGIGILISGGILAFHPITAKIEGLWKKMQN